MSELTDNDIDEMYQEEIDRRLTFQSNELISFVINQMKGTKEITKNDDGTITVSIYRTSPYFWDCDCEKDYIHPVVKDECPACSARRIDCPQSSQIEVDEFLRGIKC